MFNQYSTYVLTDANAQRTLYLANVSLPVGLFVQHNLLDTKCTAIHHQRFNAHVKPALQPGRFYSWFRGMLTELDPSEVTNIAKEKAARAQLLAEGYGHLLWHANLATESTWAGDALDYSDLPLLTNYRHRFVEMYASAKGISLEASEKQIAFEEATLYSNALRRKDLLLTHSTTLLAVRTAEDLMHWKQAVTDTTVNVGTA